MEPTTTVVCDVVIPCRDEEQAIGRVLQGLPERFRAIVVDNGSRDGTARVAHDHGATVVAEDRPGYGAAVHTGATAAKADYLAVLDGDATMDAADLDRMLDAVIAGRARMAVGRRRPTGRGVWPWHARFGNALLSAIIRRRSGFGIHDLAPMRVSRRDDLLELDVRDRRFGYPLELMLRAAMAGWTVEEFDISYGRRPAGTKSKVSGSVRGTARVIRDFLKVLRTTGRGKDVR